MIRPRILVVDDEPAMTRMLRGYLDETGKFEVRTENNAKKVMAVAQEFRPDLILLDVMMPDLDGVVVARTIRLHPALRDVRIVILTGMIKEDFLPQGTEIGGHPFLVKPVDARDLLDCVERELTKRAA